MLLDISVCPPTPPSPPLRAARSVESLRKETSVSDPFHALFRAATTIVELNILVSDKWKIRYYSGCQFSAAPEYGVETRPAKSYTHPKVEGQGTLLFRLNYRCMFKLVIVSMLFVSALSPTLDIFSFPFSTRPIVDSSAQCPHRTATAIPSHTIPQRLPF
jgi:hypothetical protein